ncbi:MAG: DNA helicase RecQ [Ruminococcus sp.]|nr:DNA helicase RecQ [Ruminococcus sp.]
MYEVLKNYFGHEKFKEGQKEIISSILSGRDTLGIMPTGAGKSLCYQIPSVMLDGITLVISPLISLMKDQVNSLRESGVNCAFINSSLNPFEYREIFSSACAGAYKIIYVAPERLHTQEFISFSENIKISMITVDEAHCVSHWGHDFRPSYLKIKDFINKLPYRPVISAFTATATPEVKKDISSLLGLKDPFVLTTSFDRENLYFGVVKPSDKYEKLKELLADYHGKSGIIYCTSRKKVEEVCEKLIKDGYSASRYHAGLSQEERNINQEDFIYDRKKIMVATNAFGMGIDKSDVGFVIHYNMPKNIESYYQEAGRAGRDGEPADCILMYNSYDVHTIKFMIDNNRDSNTELTESMRNLIYEKDMERLKDMTFYCSTSECLRKYILRYFGENHGNFCGNCSCCLTNHETVDITFDAQKIISCVYRIHQAGKDCGKSLIVDVLRGSRNAKVINSGLDKISTYSIMKDSDISRIRSELDFLTEHGYLTLTEDKNVRFSANSASVLKGEKKITMKLPKEEKIIAKYHKEKEYFEKDKLFALLRELRNEIAKRKNIPAYMVFSDSSLKDMCRKLPKTKEEFTEVSGVGNKKAEKYAGDFCKVIADYVKNNPDAPKAPEEKLSYMEKQLALYKQYAMNKKSK